MTRTAETTQTFLQWHDDIPYLITWTPGPVVGTLSAHVADDDFAQLAAEPWSTDIRMEVATAALAQSIHPVKDAGGGRRQAATAEAGLAFRQFQGRSSSMRLAG
ncbi:protein of unknown function [Magnetospirillum gryphiswaldense MSR-1 v2]|uniref:Uncharacterized protein n=1 Tax=Magnetospirillum gryphiswaldense (strain DSM 6361 / JCM 21280 / NBRC 15271 / MSR-1) TaxID=431944 RepID=V6F6F0_MAGGM|nr:hypothetical protein [Magnetospirillum gryphiswaldense]CDK99871.1 protein of unknown function [Magnetospirillum gryphiswaldense MSR-1 v2]